LIDSLKDKKNLIALVGASNDRNKYGNKILLDLLSKNYNVVPINQKEDTIAGLKAYTKVQGPTLSSFNY
jgi:predicted CoA-binding protein